MLLIGLFVYWRLLFVYFGWLLNHHDLVLYLLLLLLLLHLHHVIRCLDLFGVVLCLFARLSLLRQHRSSFLLFFQLCVQGFFTSLVIKVTVKWEVVPINFQVSPHVTQ